MAVCGEMARHGERERESERGVCYACLSLERERMDDEYTWQKWREGLVD